MSTDTEATTTTTTDANQGTVIPEQDTTSQPNVETDGQETGQGRTFTQAQVDALIGERAKRAKNTTTQKALDTLGVSSLADAVAIIDAHKKAQEADMSEAEKLQTQLTSKETEFAALQTKHAANVQRQSILEEAVKKEHGLSPDTFETLLKLVDMKLVNIDDDGIVTGADKAITQAIKDHPVLKANGSRGSGVGSPVPGNATPSLTPQKEDGKSRRPKFHL